MLINVDMKTRSLAIIKNNYQYNVYFNINFIPNEKFQAHKYTEVKYLDLLCYVTTKDDKEIDSDTLDYLESFVLLGKELLSEISLTNEEAMAMALTKVRKLKNTCDTSSKTMNDIFSKMFIIALEIIAEVNTLRDFQELIIEKKKLLVKKERAERKEKKKIRALAK